MGDGSIERDDDGALTPPASMDAPAPAPVALGERILSIDALRGFALLGILVMNMPWMSGPAAWFWNPTLAPNPSGADLWAFRLESLLVDMKMMSIFSMLYGAGILIFTERAAARGRSAMALYARRSGALAVIGLVHGYLIWMGDILFAYAVVGLLVAPLRRLSAVWLIVIGLAVTSVGIPINLLQGAMLGEMKRDVDAITVRLDAGEEISEEDAALLEEWEEGTSWFAPTEESLAEEREARLGGYTDNLVYRAPQVLMFQTLYLFFWSIWRAGGMMLLGMGLYKLGVFSGALTTTKYLLMTILGYALGLPIVQHGLNLHEAGGFDGLKMMQGGFAWNYVGSVLVALGHVGAVMLVCKLGATLITRPLAAVGRMALSNYLAQSVFGTLLFLGYGFALWGDLSRVEQLYIVAGVWAAQLVWSPLWLARFRFGPVEWAWRSLTYGRFLPFRRARTETAG